jgi:hypothetical protein
LRNRCEGLGGRRRGWNRRGHRWWRMTHQRSGPRRRCALLPGRGWRGRRDRSWRDGRSGWSAGRRGRRLRSCGRSRCRPRRRPGSLLRLPGGRRGGCGLRLRRRSRSGGLARRRPGPFAFAELLLRLSGGRSSGRSWRRRRLFPFAQLLFRLACWWRRGCRLSLRSRGRSRRRPFPFPELLLRRTGRRRRRSRSLWRCSRRGRRRRRWWRGSRWSCRRWGRRRRGSRRGGRRWRRGGLGRCCRGWRCRGRRGFRRCRGRLTLRRLLGFAVRTELFLRRGLRHHQGCRLRIRRRVSEVQRCKGCRGKQHEAKFCHDDLGPWGKPWQERKQSRCAEPVGATINSQPLGRIVAGYKRKTLFISRMQGVACAVRSLRIQTRASKFIWFPGVIGRESVIGATGRGSRTEQRRASCVVPCSNRRACKYRNRIHSGLWHTASILWPSGSSTKAP